MVHLSLLGSGIGLLFVLLKNALHARLVELQGFVLISLAQALDQGIELQAGDFLAQPFAKAGAQAVGQVLVVGGWFISGGEGEGRHQAQAKNKITRHGRLLLRRVASMPALLSAPCKYQQYFNGELHLHGAAR
ncbi:hypothetical protein D3C80_1838910 [compost metagenome]